MFVPIRETTSPQPVEPSGSSEALCKFASPGPKLPRLVLHKYGDSDSWRLDACGHEYSTQA